MNRDPATVPPHRSLVSLSRRGLRDPGTVTALDAHARRQAASRPDIGCPRRYLIRVRTLPESAGPFRFSSSIGSHDKTADVAQAQPFLRCVLTRRARANRARVWFRLVSEEKAGRGGKSQPARTELCVCVGCFQISSVVVTFDNAPRGCVPPLLVARTWGLDPGRPGVPPPVLPLPASMSWSISVLIFCCHILPCPAKLKGSRVTRAQKLLLVPSPISLSPKTSFCLFQKNKDKFRGSYGIAHTCACTTAEPTRGDRRKCMHST